MKEAIANPRVDCASSNPVVRNGDGAATDTNQTGILSACDRSNSEKSSLDHYPQSHNNPDWKPDGEDEQSILSVSDYPACGYRVLINVHGDRFAIPENKVKPLPEWDMPKAPECVLRVSVTSADRSCSFEVKEKGQESMEQVKDLTGQSKEKGGEIQKQAGEAAEGTQEKAKEAVEGVKEKTGGSEGQEGEDKVGETIEGVKGKFEETTEKMKERTGEAVQDVKEKVHESAEEAKKESGGKEDKTEIEAHKFVDAMKETVSGFLGGDK
eukprot:gene21673-24575_t